MGSKLVSRLLVLFRDSHTPHLLTRSNGAHQVLAYGSSNSQKRGPRPPSSPSPPCPSQRIFGGVSKGKSTESDALEAIMTRRRSSPDRLSLYRCGMDAWLTKPLSRATLIAELTLRL